MIVSHSNLTSYEGVEGKDQFKDPKALDAYCDLLLKKSQEQVQFIAKQLKKKGIRAIEFCSGNSRIMYAMVKAGILKSGTAIEISKSRHEFAESWRRRLGIDTVKNIQGDVLGAFVLNPVADLALCLTGAFQYMEPISPDGPGIVLRSLRRGLSKGGTLILELYPCPRLIKPGALNQDWTELPLGDPWRFYLSRTWYEEKTKFIHHRKIFIDPKGAIDEGRMDVMRVYTPSEISDMLDANGFEMIGYHGDWIGGKADPMSETNVVVARGV